MPQSDFNARPTETTFQGVKINPQMRITWSPQQKIAFSRHIVQYQLVGSSLDFKLEELYQRLGIAGLGVMYTAVVYPKVINALKSRMFKLASDPTHAPSLPGRIVDGQIKHYPDFMDAWVKPEWDGCTWAPADDAEAPPEVPPDVPPGDDNPARDSIPGQGRPSDPATPPPTPRPPQSAFSAARPERDSPRQVMASRIGIPHLPGQYPITPPNRSPSMDRGRRSGAEARDRDIPHDPLRRPSDIIRGLFGPRNAGLQLRFPQSQAPGRPGVALEAPALPLRFPLPRFPLPRFPPPQVPPPRAPPPPVPPRGDSASPASLDEYKTLLKELVDLNFAFRAQQDQLMVSMLLDGVVEERLDEFRQGRDRVTRRLWYARGSLHSIGSSRWMDLTLAVMGLEL